MPEAQSFTIPQSQGDKISVRNQAGLVAARTGTTDTGVLSFDGTGTVTVGADSIEAVNTAASGTVIRIRTAGRYVCEVGAIKVGDADSPITFGFSVNQTASLNAVAAFATAGVLAVVPIAAPAAALVNVPFLYTTEITVTNAMARAVVGGVQGAQVRFLARAAAGAPAAGLAQTPAWYFVRWVGPSPVP